MAGNFHFAPAERLREAVGVLDPVLFAFQQFNVSHDIAFLSFGDRIPGVRNPLDGHSKQILDGYGMYQYYIKVVPTTYKYLDGDDPDIQSNQYSVTEHLRHVNPGSHRGLPGVFFFYDISAIHAVFEEQRRRGLSEFLVNVFAIVGGVFTLLGFVDTFIHGFLKLGDSPVRAPSRRASG